jgi:hypothetical protein
LRTARSPVPPKITRSNGSTDWEEAVTRTPQTMPDGGQGRMARYPGFSPMVPVKYQIDYGSAYEFMKRVALDGKSE